MPIIAANTAFLLRQRAAELGRIFGPTRLSTITYAIQGLAAQISGADYVAATIGAQQLGRELALFFENVDVFLRRPSACRRWSSAGST